MPSWPLTTVLVRLLWLRALCGVAEGTAAPAAVGASAAAKGHASAHAEAAQCVAAVLGDPQKRLCTLGGCDDMPRSLGSVLGSFVARFLGGFSGKVSRTITIPTDPSWSASVAISRDGSTLLVSESGPGSNHGVQIFSVTTGVHVRTLGGTWGDGPLQFNYPRQIWIAPDDFVFVAESGNNRVQILTPRFQFHSVVGVRQPNGVCADGEVIFVAGHAFPYCISVFRRCDGALCRQFGLLGSDDGMLYQPRGLCFMGSHSRIAAVDFSNNRVSVFSFKGEFVGSMGVGELTQPTGVACSESGDELVVADWGNQRVVIFSASGEVLHVTEGDRFVGVATYNGAIFAQHNLFKCVVYT